MGGTVNASSRKSGNFAPCHHLGVDMVFLCSPEQPIVADSRLV